MTKEMETSAGLFIAASSYAAKSLDETVTQKAADGLHYAFIAGAEWQKAQPLSQAIQMKIDEFELMRKDRDEAFLRIGELENLIPKDPPIKREGRAFHIHWYGPEYKAHGSTIAAAMGDTDSMVNEATGGFTAAGETQADLAPVTYAKARIFENFKKSLDEMLAEERAVNAKPTIEQRVAHLEQYVFGD